MTSFIIIAAVIVLASLAILIWPLLRTRNTVSYARQEQNIHYAKERLEELEAQLKNASISATDYEALKLEIETTLAHDIDIANNAPQEDVAGPRRSNKIAISLLVVFLPLSALGVYLQVGTPKALDAVIAQSQPTQQQVEGMISDLEKRLEENPNDLEGWQVLAQTYLALGRYQEARQGYQRILTLGGESAHAYASLADATALAAGGQITEEVSQYLKRALTINPDNRQALWLSGLGAAQRGDKVMAKTQWGRLVPLLDDAPQQQQELRTIIQENFGDADEQITSSPQSQPMQQSQVAAQQNSLPSLAQEGLTLNISLSAEMAQLANPNDFVFVFARAQQGPPAPLAVKRLRVADLPTTITLSDADSMVAPMTLSKFENVIVSARVSKSGQPIAQTGDLQSAVIPSKNTSEEPIDLLISEIVE